MVSAKICMVSRKCMNSANRCMISTKTCMMTIIDCNLYIRKKAAREKYELTVDEGCRYPKYLKY